jgi:hypothetical protein
MRASLTIVLLLSMTAAVSAQTVYYDTLTGENYATESWHSAPLAVFKAAPPDNVYDIYTVQRQSDGTTVLHRDLTSPSGDWRFELTYEYGRDARLQKIRSVFVTFGGVAVSRDEDGLTRCVRTFKVLGNGALHKTSERITDEKTGRVVARQFYEPRITHWMSLDQLPIRPKI